MKTLLHEEIANEFDKLSTLEPESKEHAVVVESIVKLMDRAIELDKLEESATHNEKKMHEEKVARLIKNLIDIGGVVLPLAVTVWGACVSFEFEKSDSVTTAIGRKFMDKLIKK
jgi:hypothetical protein